MSDIKEVLLRVSEFDELELFYQMEADEDTREFVIQHGLEKHQREFAKDDIVYLSIVDDQDKLLGYFVLALENDGRRVEFRRIVVKEKNQGIGRRAIKCMEDYCLEVIRAESIWLDVFDFNERGIHLYESLGYGYLRSEEYQGKSLRIYEKTLVSE